MTSGDCQTYFTRQQIAIQRRNYGQVCRLAVKTLIDKSCFDPIDDGCESFVNFCSIMETLLTHRIKNNTSWYSSKKKNGESTSFWNYIKLACKKVPHNCLSNIKAMEHLENGKEKGRAWLRVVLMEKRLSEYMSTAIDDLVVTRRFYNDGAFLLSDEAHMLTNHLIGLNAIDFSFDLKGSKFDYVGTPVIDYTTYLHFQQCPESVNCDERELEELSCASESVAHAEEALDLIANTDYEAKCCHLEKKMKSTLEQKGYLEELLRRRERQLEDNTRQKNQVLATLRHMEMETHTEKIQLESVIIELQAQLSAAKEDYRRLNQQIRAYLHIQDQRQRSTSDPSQTPDGQQISMEKIDGRSVSSGDLSSQQLGMDSRSITSNLSSMTHREDTQSMIPLAGSFSSLTSNRSNETSRSSDGPTRGRGHRLEPETSLIKKLVAGRLVTDPAIEAEEGAFRSELNSPIEEEPQESAQDGAIAEDGNQNADSLAETINDALGSLTSEKDIYTMYHTESLSYDEEEFTHPNQIPGRNDADTDDEAEVGSHCTVDSHTSLAMVHQLYNINPGIETHDHDDVNPGTEAHDQDDVQVIPDSEVCDHETKVNTGSKIHDHHDVEVNQCSEIHEDLKLNPNSGAIAEHEDLEVNSAIDLHARDAIITRSPTREESLAHEIENSNQNASVDNTHSDSDDDEKDIYAVEGTAHDSSDSSDDDIYDDPVDQPGTDLLNEEEPKKVERDYELEAELENSNQSIISEDHNNSFEIQENPVDNMTTAHAQILDNSSQKSVEIEQVIDN